MLWAGMSIPLQDVKPQIITVLSKNIKEFTLKQPFHSEAPFNSLSSCTILAHTAANMTKITEIPAEKKDPHIYSACIEMQCQHPKISTIPPCGE